MTLTEPDGLLFQKRRDEIYKEPHGRIRREQEIDR
jgi:hypothetical protein